VSRQALCPAPVDHPTADSEAAVLLDLLDHYAPGVTAHMERTAELADRVAWALQLPDHVHQLSVRAAWLHDVGKLKVPAWVLAKPGPLSTGEWALMREHPVLGERLLERTPGLLAVAPLVRSTHERWDGEGYPDGLAGMAIPLPSRVVAACDAFDAMTHPRGYSQPLSVNRAVWELHRNAGTQFDRYVVDALCDVLTDGIDVGQKRA
jgi:two-component system, cell cycle response regulator